MNARSKYRAYLLLFMFLGLYFYGTVVYASTGVSWDQLSAKEQNVLIHLKQHWNKYPAFKQKKMQRWARQPASQRRLIKTRFKQWSALSSVRKNKIKLQLKRYRSKTPAERLKLKAWWRWLKRLPRHEQDKLKHKLPGMNKQQKKDYIRELEKKYGHR